MTVERALRLIAGALVSISVLLGIYLNANVLWFTLFVGVNLFQSAFTKWCPMMVVLRTGGRPDGSGSGTPAASGRESDAPRRPLRASAGGRSGRRLTTRHSQNTALIATPMAAVPRSSGPTRHS